MVAPDFPSTGFVRSREEKDLSPTLEGSAMEVDGVTEDDEFRQGSVAKRRCLGQSGDGGGFFMRPDKEAQLMDVPIVECPDVTSALVVTRKAGGGGDCADLCSTN